MRPMKDSGVEWIGEIPGTWSVGRIKYNFYLKGRIGWQGLKADEFIDEGPYLVTGTDFKNGRVDWTTCYHISDERFDEAPEIHVHEGDILITKDGTVGKVAYIDRKPEKVSLNSHLLIMRPVNTQYNNKFLFWIIQSEVFEKFFQLSQNGTIMASLSQEKINGFSFPLPLEDEQQRVADYLDAKCAKIDALIAKQQEIIEKLKAYKLSVITEAVTKGLNPNVPMKDSGVEWIGAIPAQWKLSHIGNLAEIGAGGTPDRKKPEYWENGTIPWMASGEINYEYVYDTAEKITELGMQNSNAKLLPMNTVMLGLIGQGKTKGMTAILKTECTCNQNLAYLIPNPDLLHYRYLFYCFKAMYHYIRGLVGESQAGIYQDFLKKQHIPLPNIEVQAEICDYLDRVAAAIDIYVVRREEQIKKLVNYKKSLIYEVVTGKREVSP